MIPAIVTEYTYVCVTAIPRQLSTLLAMWLEEQHMSVEI